ncbi:hypothetical protein [Botrimarina hoheduenensis]|uniref:LTD domain-containing protein n=1 Tax=Botrimarina hoheduenensis TaxID=2528000 RepID=A0A5C5VXU2_9BACT|nr:hypothetical protein [Botrimarina hoheduenensis]TWT43458.1 hypothetical protein Pla111_24090 [Botrimarina hoheduenensis]
MRNVETVRLKPNPSGKDRTRGGYASATQLGAEWVDLKNVGTTSCDLGDVEVYHIAYSDRSDSGRWEKVTGFNGKLPAGKIVRVHSGSGPINVLRDEDQLGADFHIFTQKDSYIWNNDRGDCSGLFMVGASQPFDKACYDAYPPEGEVLQRSGNKLVPTSTAASRRL